MVIIAQGAEAIIERSTKALIKNRIPKSYRIKELDERLRKQRTRKEVKLLEKSFKLIPTPKVISSTETSITLEEIKGKKLAECLNSLKNSKEICEQIGQNVAKIHDGNIIHGDLTTSNMIIKENKVYFIDYGLGFESNEEEHKAVDLHVLREALDARHFKNAAKFWDHVLQGYNISVNAPKVLKRLEVVEKRGRYKQAY